MAKTINLGKKHDVCCSAEIKTKDSEPKVYYPTVYLGGIKGLDVELGPISFKATGKVVSVSERESARDGKKSEEYTCEIELHEITKEEGLEDGDIEDSMDRIVAKKSKSY